GKLVDDGLHRDRMTRWTFTHHRSSETRRRNAKAAGQDCRDGFRRSLEHRSFGFFQRAFGFLRPYPPEEAGRKQKMLRRVVVLDRSDPDVSIPDRISVI